MMQQSEREYAMLLERVETGAGRSYVNALRRIDRVIGATMPRADASSPTKPVLANGANGLPDAQTVDTAPAADGGVGGGVIKGLDAPENDQMEWLAEHSMGIPALINPDTFQAPPTAREKRLSRLGVKGIEASPQANGEGGINLDDVCWIEGEYELYSKLPSKQRKDVWMALKGMNVTADQPSCDDLAYLSGVSHTTCAKVLPLYRQTHAIKAG